MSTHTHMFKKISKSALIFALVGVIITSIAPQISFAVSQASFSSSGMFLVGDHRDSGTQNWQSQLTNIQPGDQVAFKFTFLNTSSITAIDAKSSFTATTNGNSIQVTGKIWAQNAPAVQSTVTITAASGYSISLSQMSASFGGVGDVLPGTSGIEYYATGLYNIVGQSTGGDAPIVQTLPADEITQTSASVNGTVHPNGGTNTTLWFEYGTSASLGAKTPTKALPQGQATLTTFADIYGLSQNTTYYFKIVAQNEYGTSHGSTLTFKTSGQTQTPTANLWAEYNGQTVTQVPKGTAPTLKWTSSNATQCDALAGAGFSTGGATQGSDVVSALAGSTTFSIRCIGAGGSVQKNYTVSVEATNPGSAPLVTTNQASGISQTSATLNGQVNPNGANTSYWFEYGTTQSLGQSTGAQGIGSGTSAQSVNFSLVGLSQNTTYYFRAVAQNSYGTAHGSILSFTTSGQSASAPYAQTYAASGVSQTSATLNGQVNPNGANTSYWFEYGTTQSLGQSTSMQSAGAGTSWVNSTAYISGLTQNTTYYFRVVAQNSQGTAHGSILSFVTQSGGGGGGGSAPTVQTLPATGLSQNSATLNGSINPNGASTYYWFEFGTTQSLGQTTSAQSLGAGTTSQDIAGYIFGLSQNTTYYFRAVGQNSYGTNRGATLSFTTSGGGGTTGSAPTVLTNPASGISQTSATLNGQVNPNGANTSYWFEYGTTQSLGQTTAMQSIGSGTSLVSINGYISGLSQNTTYYFRAVAQNNYGTVQGSTLSFVTSGGGGTQGEAPYVQTYNATNIGEYSATLQGSVDPNGSQTSYWFEYGTSYSLGQSTNMQSVGSGTYATDVSRYISGLVRDETYYFRIVGQNSYGTSYGQILSFRTEGNTYDDDLYVETDSATSVGQTSATLNGYVESNESYQNVYGWFEYGINSYSMYLSTSQQSLGSYVSTDFSRSVSGLTSGTTYYYRAVARISNGETAYGQIRSFTTSGYGGYGQQPSVITDPATIVTQNSALFNGRVNPNGGVTTAWFEYGPSTGLGLSTIHQPMGSGNILTNFAAAVSGLLPNTTYYFRAVAQNQHGTGYGSILSFTTSGTIIVPPVTPINPQPPVIIRTGGEGLSCVILVPALNVSALQAGEEFTYTVTYRNGCSYSLNNAFLKVILPTETEFLSTNYPFFNMDANGISYSLGAIPSGFQSAISIQGRVLSQARRGDTLIFSSVLNFNDYEDRFQSVSAYLTAVVASGKTLTATVLDAFSSLFGNWLFDLLLILLILFLIWWIFFRRDEEEERVDVLRDDAVSARPYNN